MDKFVRRLSGPQSLETPSQRHIKRVKTDQSKSSRERSPSLVAQEKTGSSASYFASTDNDIEDDDCNNIFIALNFKEDVPIGVDDAHKQFTVDDALAGENHGQGPDELSETRKKRKSIYVEAFDIALETVLERERCLFNAKEMAVFSAWRRLDYEAQYLYVRLFLRKEAAWHRTLRLNYCPDVSDMQLAVDMLLLPRVLPDTPEDDTETALRVTQKWALGSSFTFVDTFDYEISSVKDSVGILTLDELKWLAKQRKIRGKNKADFQTALVAYSASQTTLAFARSQHSSTRGLLGRGHRLDGEYRLIEEVEALTKPCIRVSQPAFKLFERVHLLFYRTPEWTEKSLTTLVLAKASRCYFCEYIVSRTTNIFGSRLQLLDFEEALRVQYDVDQMLSGDGNGGPAGEPEFRRVVHMLGEVVDHWRKQLRDEQCQYDSLPDTGESVYLRQFKAAHVYTRIVHYGAYALGRLHEYRQEHALLEELLGQQLFRTSKRGAWYQRKALIEEHYMATEYAGKNASEQDRKRWQKNALQTCERALEDRNCHLVYHYDLQRRITKLERRLRIPRRLQHDFGHLQLLVPKEHFIRGVQIKKALVRGEGMGTKTLWLDESSGADVHEMVCPVEDMCLKDYQKHGWKGYHSEGGIVRTLFAYLFCDILFLPVPNVFQTAYQTCPLDLGTDAFYAARASEINQRLVDISNGDALRLVREAHAAHYERRTRIVGLDWDFTLEDVVELVQCFRGDALALVCKVLAQEYRLRVSGLPDLLLWRTEPTPDVLFAEVKSANDRLSDTQRMWIHVLASAGVKVAVCHAVAKEVRVI